MIAILSEFRIIRPALLTWAKASSVMPRNPLLLRPAIPGREYKGEIAESGDWVNVTFPNNQKLMFGAEVAAAWEVIERSSDSISVRPKNPWRVLHAADAGIELPAILKAPEEWRGHPGWIIVDDPEKVNLSTDEDVPDRRLSTVILAYSVYSRKGSTEPRRAFIGEPNFAGHYTSHL